jgi:hypothetical protein
MDLYPLKAEVEAYVSEEVDLEKYANDPLNVEKHEIHLAAFYAGHDQVVVTHIEKCYVVGHVVLNDIDNSGQIANNVYLMIVKSNGQVEFRYPNQVKVDFKELELLYREKWQALRKP